jgi:antitoxin component YwqK of YwqJK toxin-antitoxin module
VRGALSGDSKTYLPDGSLLEHARYRQGKLHGLLERFHGNGQLAERQLYGAGKPIEPGERYAQDGRQLDADGKPLSRWRRWWHMLPGTSPAPQ